MKPNTTSYRVLVRLQFFDHASNGDLSVALNLPCAIISSSLRNCVAKGYVEREDKPGAHPQYRISAAGRAWLASQKVAA